MLLIGEGSRNSYNFFFFFLYGLYVAHGYKDLIKIKVKCMSNIVI